MKQYKPQLVVLRMLSLLQVSGDSTAPGLLVCVQGGLSDVMA